jgi:hypothetical protein
MGFTSIQYIHSKVHMDTKGHVNFTRYTLHYAAPWARSHAYGCSLYPECAWVCTNYIEQFVTETPITATSDLPILYINCHIFNTPHSGGYM